MIIFAVGIFIIHILVKRMFEDAAAERYCVSFLQNQFYDSKISGRSWRGNSKILLHLHCNSTCCQNSSDLMVHLKWLLLLSKLVRTDGVCLMVHLWPRFCVCLEDFVKEVFSPILHERLLCHWEGWEIPLCIPYHSLREARNDENWEGESFVATTLQPLDNAERLMILVTVRVA